MFQDGGEDLRDGLAIELVAVHHVEVPHETRRNAGPSSTRRTKCCKDKDVFYLHELLILAIVPTLVVHELSQQFDRWLSTVFLLLRHVQIINKDNVLLSYWCTEYASLDLV